MPDKQQLVREIGKYTHPPGAAFIKQKELMRFYGAADYRTIKPITDGLERYMGKYYIRDVAERILITR